MLQRVPNGTVRRFDAAMDAARIGMQEAAANPAEPPVAGFEKGIAAPCTTRLVPKATCLTPNAPVC